VILWQKSMSGPVARSGILNIGLSSTLRLWTSLFTPLDSGMEDTTIYSLDIHLLSVTHGSEMEKH
jgi:hypothetical protein